jgi:hypothetical protein
MNEIAGALAPPPAEQQRIWDAVASRARAYVANLPNFLCRQTTRRAVDPRGKNEWQDMDIIDELLTYSDGQESYIPIKKAAEAHNAEGLRKKGVSSRGEMGGAFAAIFGEKVGAQYSWKAWAEHRGERVLVFSYTVPHASSVYGLNWEGRFKGKTFWHHTPGIEGEVFLHPETFAIRRITLRTTGVPTDFPLQEAQHEIDYEFQRIGEFDFLLPIRGVLTTRAGRRLIRNELEFTGYRKWSAESRLVVEK